MAKCYNVTHIGNRLKMEPNQTNIIIALIGQTPFPNDIVMCYTILAIHVD
jgi:hypothetical protein